MTRITRLLQEFIKPHGHWLRRLVAHVLALSMSQKPGISTKYKGLALKSMEKSFQYLILKCKLQHNNLICKQRELKAAGISNQLAW